MKDLEKQEKRYFLPFCNYILQTNYYNFEKTLKSIRGSEDVYRVGMRALFLNLNAGNLTKTPYFLTKQTTAGMT